MLIITKTIFLFTEKEKELCSALFKSNDILSGFPGLELEVSK